MIIRHRRSWFADHDLATRLPEEQGYTFSFSQLTINADTHPLLRRMHKPGDEKRSLVIVPPDDYDAWLGCQDPELGRTYLAQPPIEQLTGIPMSLVRRG